MDSVVKYLNSVTAGSGTDFRLAEGQHSGSRGEVESRTGCVASYQAWD
jgi:hypothetical protein